MTQMSRWVRRGQCQGRPPRSASEARLRQACPVFQPVSAQWQERQCRKLRLPLVRTLKLSRPRPPPPLRNQEPCLVHETGSDGNCLFRCLSLVITGSENHHNLVRQRIVSHISRNCNAFSALLPESSETGSGNVEACEKYLSTSKMAAGSTWGSDVEILAAAHMLRTRIYVYTLHGPAWQWVEHGMELTDPTRKPHRESIFLMHTGLVHYDLVDAVRHCSEQDKDSESPPPTESSPPESKKTCNGKIRPRGYSVPCPLLGARCSSNRRRSASRSSSRSVVHSSDGYSSSNVESGTSSVSGGASSVDCDRSGSEQQLEAPTFRARRRSRRPCSGSQICNNNNCLRDKSAACGSRKKAPSSAKQVVHTPKSNTNTSCSVRKVKGLQTKIATARAKNLRRRRLNRIKSLVKVYTSSIKNVSRPRRLANANSGKSQKNSRGVKKRQPYRVYRQKKRGKTRGRKKRRSGAKKCSTVPVGVYICHGC